MQVRKFVFAVGLALVLGLVPLALLGPPAEGAATLPRGFSEERITGGLDRPTAMAFAPDGRLFVLQQGGAVRVVESGRLLRGPALELRVDSRGERGLLGIALDPAFGRNGHVYLYHTTRGAGPKNRISRYTIRGNKAVAGSRRTILDLDPLSDAQNHNGGALHFGPDGKLYAAVDENATPENAQSLNNLHGKLLRINKDGSIPRDNPFSRETRGKDRAIWARGLRNPYSFAFQRGTGRMFVNDVGGTKWEEINRGKRGANYGWPAFEGPEKNRRYVAPIHAYRHAANNCNAITGGAFYDPRRADFPARFADDYFFADVCRGFVRVRDSKTGRVSGFAKGLEGPVDLRVGPDGALYVLERGSGAVTAIRHEG